MSFGHDLLDSLRSEAEADLQAIEPQVTEAVVPAISEIPKLFGFLLGRLEHALGAPVLEAPAPPPALGSESSGTVGLPGAPAPGSPAAEAEAAAAPAAPAAPPAAAGAVETPADKAARLQRELAELPPGTVPAQPTAQAPIVTSS